MKTIFISKYWLLKARAQCGGECGRHIYYEWKRNWILSLVHDIGFWYLNSTSVMVYFRGFGMMLFKRLSHLPLCLQKLRAFFVLFVFFLRSYIVRIFFQKNLIFVFPFCKITINMLHKNRDIYTIRVSFTPLNDTVAVPEDRWIWFTTDVIYIMTSVMRLTSSNPIGCRGLGENFSQSGKWW